MNQIARDATSRLVFALILVSISSMCLANTGIDTVYLKFSPSNLFFHDEVGKHPRDPHPEDNFPFNGMNGYRLRLNEKNYANTIYFVFASHGPKDTGIPFHYKTVDNNELNQIYWLTEESLLKWPYLEIIRYFKNKNKVIMLYDTTQPPGAEQYLVRVYFDFDAWE